MIRATRWNTSSDQPWAEKIGDHTVTYLPDGNVQLSPRGWLPDSSDLDWRDPDNLRLLDAEGYLVASIGALLIEKDGRSMLVDAGFGPRRWPANRTHPVLGVLQGGGLLDSLTAVGRRPEDIEVIAFTHLHDDHFGWVFAADGDPFARVALAASVDEWSWWPGSGSVPGGRRRGVRDGEEVFPGVVAYSTPGHTPGHVSYVVSSGADSLIVLGDAFHSTVQLARPHWRVAMDMAPEMGVATRRRVCQDLLANDGLVFGNHFSDVQLGRLAATEGGPNWVPAGRESV